MVSMLFFVGRVTFIWVEYFGYLDIKLSKCVKILRLLVIKNSNRRMKFLL